MLFSTLLYFHSTFLIFLTKLITANFAYFNGWQIISNETHNLKLMMYYNIYSKYVIYEKSLNKIFYISKFFLYKNYVT